MDTCPGVSDFQRHCQRLYICYSLAVLGLQEQANKFSKLHPDLSKSLIVGTGHPEDGRWHGSMNIGEYLKASQRSGSFPDTIGKSFLTTIYSSWDEYFRSQIAQESGVDHKSVKSGLMGDLRRIRHCIVHKKSIVTDEAERFEELSWELPPGYFQVTEEMFQSFIEQVNKMAIRIE
jgi:hypothetical protein